MTGYIHNDIINRNERKGNEMRNRLMLSTGLQKEINTSISPQWGGVYIPDGLKALRFVNLDKFSGRVISDKTHIQFMVKKRHDIERRSKKLAKTDIKHVINMPPLLLPDTITGGPNRPTRKQKRKYKTLCRRQVKLAQRALEQSLIDAEEIIKYS